MTGVVLAGGESIRMGVEKASLWFRGETLLERAVRRMRTGVPAVIVVGKPEVGAIVPRGVEFLEDDSPGRGPVMAIVTALRHTKDDCAVVACDMPHFDPALLMYEWTAMKDGKAAVPHYDGLWEPLHAVYSVRALDYIEDWHRRSTLVCGRRPRIIEMLTGLAAVQIDRESVLRFGRPDVLFSNINAPSEYYLALSRPCLMEETSTAR